MFFVVVVLRKYLKIMNNLHELPHALKIFCRHHQQRHLQEKWLYLPTVVKRLKAFTRQRFSRNDRLIAGRAERRTDGRTDGQASVIHFKPFDQSSDSSLVVLSFPLRFNLAKAFEKVLVIHLFKLSTQ